MKDGTHDFTETLLLDESAIDVRLREATRIINEKVNAWLEVNKATLKAAELKVVELSNGVVLVMKTIVFTIP